MMRALKIALLAAALLSAWLGAMALVALAIAYFHITGPAIVLLAFVILAAWIVDHTHLSQGSKGR